MRYKRAFAILIFSLSLMTALVTAMREQTSTPAALQTEMMSAANDNAPRLSAQRSQHILYGDQSGGGHLYGVSKPCKSEFPPDWSADDIIATVKTLAANDNVRWSQGHNGYYTSEQMAGGVRIKIVLDREGDDVITAYPVNRRRNPCPGR